MLDITPPVDLQRHGHLAHFKPVTWIQVGPVRKTGWMCLSFEDAEGEKLRLRLPAAEAALWCSSVYWFLSDGGYAVQLARSGEMDSSAGLPHEGQLQVPSAAASAACCGELNPSKCSSPQIKCQEPLDCSRIQNWPLLVLCLYAVGVTLLALCLAVSKV